MNPYERIAAGQAAELERGQIKEAVEFVQRDLLEKIAKTLPTETDEREGYYFEYKALARVLTRLQSGIDSGKTAKIKEI